MNPAVYIALNGLVIVILTSATRIIRMREGTVDWEGDRSLAESLNQLAYQAMMTICFVIFGTSVLLNIMIPPHTLDNPLDRLTRYLVLGVSAGVPVLISIPFIKRYTRFLSFALLWVFHILTVHVSFMLHFQLQTMPMLLLSTMIVGIVCPAPSHVIVPYVFILWLLDLVFYLYRIPDFFNSPIRALLTNTGICFAIGASLGFITYHIRERECEARKALALERKKSDVLLHNTLPDVIVRELKEHGRVKARRHVDATVLFADIVGFTSIAEHLDPAVLVQWLDEIFVKFDDIAEKYCLEKLKTIGDCYMAVAGAPRHDVAHARNTINAAFEMIDTVRDFKPQNASEGKAPFFQMRIGVHSGVIVAGVIGKKKFAYDIWGDSVNVAARLEAAGAPNRINASADTARLLDGDFHCTTRGRIDVKNRAPVEMFWVEKMPECPHQNPE